MHKLPDFLSLNLKGNCLFCLINCDKNGDDGSRSPGQEQLLNLIFSEKCEGPGTNFRKLFWKLLIGHHERSASTESSDPKIKIKGENDKGVEENSDCMNDFNMDVEMNLDNVTSDVANVNVSTSNKISVCNYCLQMLTKLRGLHVELEKIQMLFVEQIKTFQKLVRGSHHIVREEMMKETHSSRIARDDLEKLCHFQASVISHGKTSVSVPYVVLEKMSNVEKIVVPVEPIQMNWSNEYNEVFQTRKRGRPPKKFFSEPDTGFGRDSKPSISNIGLQSPRKRGRPPKSNVSSINDPVIDHFSELHEDVGTDKDKKFDDNKNSDNEWSPFDADAPMENISEDDDDYSPTQKLKRKVGRPKKVSGNLESFSPKRRVGRPRKDCETTPKIRNVQKSTHKLHEKVEGESETSSKKTAKKQNYRLIIRSEERKEPEVRRKVHHRIYRCEICGKIYFKRITFLKHQLAHKENSLPAELPLDDANSALECRYDIEETKVCQICEEGFRESDYILHMLSHEKPLDPFETIPDEKFHACTHKDCIRKFQLEENLKIHMELDHNELNSRCLITVKKCDVCNVCYDTSNDLLEHFKKIHKDSRKDLIFCPVCSHVFTTNENMIIHMHSHSTNEQQLCYKCPSQNRTSLAKRSELLLHFREEHGLETSGTCSICGEEFDDIYWLKFHLRNIHKAKETFVCTYCGKTCYHPAAFMKHYTNLHKKAERAGYQCEYCLEKFPNPDKLSKHRVSIHGAPKLPCNQCGLEYMTAKALKQHVDQVHNKEGLRCEICDKYFSAKINLIQHMAKHSDAKPFTCEICGAGSKTYWQFRSHQQKHNKKHCCDQCGRRFARGWALKNHMKMHTGEVIPCQYCGYEFHSEKSLKRHVKAYHVGDEDKLRPLYPPQKRRAIRSHWKDEDGNTVYAKTENDSKPEEVEQKVEVEPSSSAVQYKPRPEVKFENIPRGTLAGSTSFIQVPSLSLATQESPAEENSARVNNPTSHSDPLS